MRMPGSRAVHLVLTLVCVLLFICACILRTTSDKSSIGKTFVGSPLRAKQEGICNQPQPFHHISMLENMIRPSYEQLMEFALGGVPHGTWVQIGANTMDNKNGNDPLKLYLGRIAGWRKIFVEPVPTLYEGLKHSIRQWPNSTAVNVAISPDPTVAQNQVDIYCLEDSFDAKLMESVLPHWANQICSFNPAHIPKHFPGKVGAPVRVNAWSVKELLRRESIENIDVLMIDTEGFDYHVLKQVPFGVLRPILIVYEHKHLEAADQEAAEKVLRDNCYGVWRLDIENTAALAFYH